MYTTCACTAQMSRGTSRGSAPALVAVVLLLLFPCCVPRARHARQQYLHAGRVLDQKAAIAELEKTIALKKELVQEFAAPDAVDTPTGREGPGGARFNTILSEAKESIAAIKEPNNLKRLHAWAAEDTRDGRRIKQLLGDLMYWNEEMKKAKRELLESKNLKQESPSLDGLGVGGQPGHVGVGDATGEPNRISLEALATTLLCCAVVVYTRFAHVRQYLKKPYGDGDWG
jgi:hypothetical protein